MSENPEADNQIKFCLLKGVQAGQSIKHYSAISLFRSYLLHTQFDWQSLLQSKKKIMLNISFILQVLGESSGSTKEDVCYIISKFEAFLIELRGLKTIRTP